MEDDIKELILSTSAALKEFASGSVSREDAVGRYNQLLKSYADLDAAQTPQGETDPLGAVCYRHNTDNFALFTGLYMMRPDGVKPVACLGDDAWKEKIAGRLATSSSFPGGLNKIIATGGEDQAAASPVLYLYGMESSSNSILVFASVSSSAFFSRELFSSLAKHIQAMIASTGRLSSPLMFDYYTRMRKTVDRTLDSMLKTGAPVIASIYIFPMLERVFSHMGIQSLIDITTGIRQTITEHCDRNAVIVPLSLKEYIVLAQMPASECNPERKRMEFSYKNITIFYTTAKFTIDSRYGLYQFWEDISVLENSLFTGDARR